MTLPSPYEFRPESPAVSDDTVRTVRRAAANRSAIIAGAVGAWAVMLAADKAVPGHLAMFAGYVSLIFVAMPRAIVAASLVVALAIADAALAPVHQALAVFADVAFPLRPHVAAAARLAVAAVVSPPRIKVVADSAALARLEPLPLWRAMLVMLPALGLWFIAFFRLM